MNKQSKVSIFIGTGGVGKTTLSSLYAVSLKNKKRSLITIDPSKRLKDLFDEDSVIEGLEISLSERTVLFNEFLSENISDKDFLNKFKDNSLFKSLMDNLSVSQEFTSFYELVKKYDDNTLDSIILDTPPLQNSADFFSGAELLEKLFSGKLVSFFIPDEDRGVFSKVFNRGREIALSSLSKLTGSEFMRELSEFFIVSQKVRGPLIETLRRAREIIREESDLCFVTSYEELSLKRVNSSLIDLRSKNLKVKKCYINRYYNSQGFYEKRLEKIINDLAIRHSDITFIKVDMINEEPTDVKKLAKWSENVSL